MFKLESNCNFRLLCSSLFPIFVKIEKKTDLNFNFKEYVVYL